MADRPLLSPAFRIPVEIEPLAADIQASTTKERKITTRFIERQCVRLSLGRHNHGRDNPG